MVMRGFGGRKVVRYDAVIIRCGDTPRSCEEATANGAEEGRQQAQMVRVLASSKREATDTVESRGQVSVRPSPAQREDPNKTEGKPQKGTAWKQAPE